MRAALLISHLALLVALVQCLASSDDDAVNRAQTRKDLFLHSYSIISLFLLPGDHPDDPGPIPPLPQGGQHPPGDRDQDSPAVEIRMIMKRTSMQMKRPILQQEQKSLDLKLEQRKTDRK